MNNFSPWDEIKSPNTDYNVRKIAESSSVPLYWGKDAEGNCLFIVELEGDHTEYFFKNRVSVHGIKTDLRQLDAVSNQRLVLTLEKHVDRDLFSGLCETLIAAVSNTRDSSTGFAVVLAHIKRWKAFMAGRKKKLLSAEEIRGLFAELNFLRTLYQGRLPEKDAVQSWLGPEESHQDFVFGNTAVEIKSLSGQERNVVRISSEDQLEALSDNLFLKIYRLSVNPESDKATSLNQMVRLVENELTDADAIELFSDKTASSGYVELREYDDPKFMISGDSTYRTTSDFPRLIRSRIPEGISRVSYDIALEKLKSFKCEQEQIWR